MLTDDPPGHKCSAPKERRQNQLDVEDHSLGRLFEINPFGQCSYYPS
jgi:hypothetical protein